MEEKPAGLVEAKLTPEQVFHDHAPRIFNLARRMLGNNTADAEDVTQEVLLQVIRKLDSFRHEASLPTWLYRVTVNAALAHRKKKAAQHEKQVGDSLENPLDNGQPTVVRRWALAPDQQALNRETQQLIEEAIVRLPEIYRDVFVLGDVEGMSNAEIAGILGLSLPAVKSRLHRARLLMRESLAPHFEEEPS